MARRRQNLIQRYVNQGPTTICLHPGTYTLPTPLVVSAGFSHLTIQGCDRGVVLAAASGTDCFVLGLVLVEGQTDFTMRNLDLALPNARFQFGADAIAGVPDELKALFEEYARELVVSIGVYVRGGSDIRFERCRFTFAANTRGNVFGAGVFATGVVTGLEVVDCAFTAPEVAVVPLSALARGEQAEPPYQVRYGYLQVPAYLHTVPFRPFVRPPSPVVRRVIQARAAAQAAAAKPVAAENEAAIARAAPVRAEVAVEAPGAPNPVLQIAVSTLADAAIERNMFDGLTVPMLVLGQVGTLRIEDNTVRSCYGGFWLVTAQSAAAALLMIDRVAAAAAVLRKDPGSLGLVPLADPVLVFASVLARLLPQSPPCDAPIQVGRIALPDPQALQTAEDMFGRLYTLAALPVLVAKAARPAARAAKAPAKAPAPGPEPVINVKLPVELADIFKRVKVANPADVVPETDVGTSLVPRLDVGGNQIDAVFADSYTGTGLFVIDLELSGSSSLICSGNRIRNRVDPGATVDLYSLVECTVTGNIISNEMSNTDSLTHMSMFLKPRLMNANAVVPAVAVTGNVLIGPINLPARPQGYPAWETYNTQINQS